MSSARPLSCLLLLSIVALSSALGACHAGGDTREPQPLPEDVLEDVASPDLDAAEDPGGPGPRPDLPPRVDAPDDEDAWRDDPLFDTTPPDAVVSTEPPEIVSVSPTQGPAAGGTYVMVVGDSFSAGMRVTLGGVEQPEVDIIDRSTFVFRTEPGEPGAKTLRVSHAAGDAVVANAFTYLDRLRLDDVEPASGSEAGGAVVQLSGRGLTDVRRVFWGDREVDVSRVIGDNQIEVVTPPGVAGQQVDVSLWTGADLVVLPEAFRYTASLALLGAVPDRVSASGGVRAIVAGRAVDSGCVARLGSVPVPLEEDSTGVVSFVVPPGEVGVRLPLVMDCGARGVARVEDAITYEADVELVALRVWPGSVSALGGDIVHLIGAGLPSSEDARVWVGDAEVSVVGGATDRLVVLVPAMSPGVRDVRVVDGLGAAWLAEGAVEVRSPASVRRLVPQAGPAGRTFTVRVEGEGLESWHAPFVDGQLWPVLQRSETVWNIAVPAGAPGMSRLRMMTEVGHVHDTGRTLERLGPTRVEGMAPRVGPTAGGTWIYVVGSGFVSDCRIAMGGEVLDTERVGTFLLRARTPRGDVGTVPVTLAGCEASWVDEVGFTYQRQLLSPGGVGGGPLQGVLTVHVREQGTFAPVAAATVHVGGGGGLRLTALTNSSGEVVFADPRLIGEVTVTAFGVDRSVESVVASPSDTVTLLLWPLPPPPCTPGDPACQSPPPPPNGVVRGNLRGLDKLQALPPGQRLQARIETTRRSQGWANPHPGPGAVLEEDGPFEITARLGDQAVVARCGIFNERNGVFTTTALAVTRGVILRPDRLDERADLVCNIPLNRQLRVRIAGADPLPTGVTDPDVWPIYYEASAFLDFGTEGVLEGFAPVRTHLPIIEGGHFPRMAGPLDGVTFRVSAGAFPLTGNVPSAQTFARGVVGFDEILVMPRLTPIPRFTVPSAEHPHLREGYIEWELDPGSLTPDLYYLTITADNAGFSRWAVFLPGDRQAFHLADFAESVGTPIPSLPAGSLRITLRALSLFNFSYASFRRGVLSQNEWRSSSLSWEVIPILIEP